MKRKDNSRYAEAVAPRSPIVKNCAMAFAVGGFICTIGQGLLDLYGNVAKMNEEDSAALCAITLVFIAALLTGIGIFDNIARHAGAGTLVPITGFANAVVSPAIDSRCEGLVPGIGATIFTVAGPVLLYGTLAGTLYGFIYWLWGLFF